MLFFITIKIYLPKMYTIRLSAKLLFVAAGAELLGTLPALHGVSFSLRSIAIYSAENFPIVWVLRMPRQFLLQVIISEIVWACLACQSKQWKYLFGKVPLGIKIERSFQIERLKSSSTASICYLMLWITWSSNDDHVINFSFFQTILHLRALDNISEIINFK